MFAPEITTDSFLPLFDDTTVGQARALLTSKLPHFTHLIILRPLPAGSTYYYLFSLAEAEQRLAIYQNEPDLPLGHAFNLHEYTATPTVSPATPADDMPDHAVLVDDNEQVLGFWDAHLPPSEATRHTAEPSLPTLTIRTTDLALVIAQRPLPTGGHELTMHLHVPEANIVFQRFDPVVLQGNPALFVQEQFRDLERFPERVAAEGATLFQTLFPEELQKLLWALQERIQYAQILSEEPWIPWEMCKLVGRENGRYLEGEFLAAQFPLTRWQVNLPAQQRQLPLRRMAVVATPAPDLATPLQEQAHLLGRATAERAITSVAPLYADVVQALSTGQHDGWHFAGHANINQFGDANRNWLTLQDGPLKPTQLNGVVRNMGNPRPLVFLNACRSGGMGFSLAGLGGFAHAFLHAGASGFIGTHWAVQDGLAAEFARTFYDGLLDQHLPLGEAIRRARAHIRRDDDPTWLAYTVYGHPLAMAGR